MSWLSRRGTDEMHALARRRLDALARPSAPPEAPLTDPEEPEHEDPDPSASPPGGPLDLVAARLPTTVRDGRVAVSRTAAAGLAFLALLALVLAGSYAWRGRAVQAVRPTDPTSFSSPQPSASPSGTPGITPPPTTPAGEVVVDVAGKVRHPGVVRLPLGSRVVDAIAAAGGVRGDVDLTGLNLARVLADGEQVVVGAEGAPAASAPPTTGQGSGSNDSVINLNTATLEQLDTLPGVGPVLAQRILDWRTAHGRFSTIDELREVSGIGDSRFADLAPRVRV